MSSFQKYYLFLYFTVLSRNFRLSQAYWGGAPAYKSACVNLTPGHGGAMKGDFSNSGLSINKQNGKNCLRNSNGSINFKLNGNYRGMIAQVRDEEDCVIGNWEWNKQSLKYLDCSHFTTGPDVKISRFGTITHNSGMESEGCEITWKRGNEKQPEPKWLKLTMVKSYTEYYTGKFEIDC